MLRGEQSMKILAKVGGIFDRTIDLLFLLATVLIVFLMLSVSADVVMRYFLGRPIFWVPEITEYSLLWITFLGTAWLLKKEGHIKMEFVIDRLSPRARVILNVITSILCAILCLGLVWAGAKFTWDNFQLGYFVQTVLEPPKFIILLIIPVGSFLLFVQFMRRTYGYLQARESQRAKVTGETRKPGL